MAAPIKVLAIALLAELNSATGKTFTRRYAPYYDSEQLVEAKYFVIATRERNSVAARTVERSDLTILVGVQQALPDTADKNDEFIENTEWLDDRMDEVETIKALFRPGGALRNKSIGGCEFKSMANDPVYMPELLLDNAIFTSMLELVYEFETEG